MVQGRRGVERSARIASLTPATASHAHAEANRVTIQLIGTDSFAARGHGGSAGGSGSRDQRSADDGRRQCNDERAKGHHDGSGLTGNYGRRRTG